MSDKDLIKFYAQDVQKKIDEEIDKTFGDKAPEIRRHLSRLAEDDSLSLPDELKDEEKLVEAYKLGNLIEFRATADGFSLVTEDGRSLVTEDGHSLITETTYPDLIGAELIKVGELLSVRKYEIENKALLSAVGKQGGIKKNAATQILKEQVLEEYKKQKWLSKTYAAEAIYRKLKISEVEPSTVLKWLYALKDES
jgi:hypothetical protein